MCGIVGYIGARSAQPLLLAGLQQLEYRGYDSAGLVTLDHGQFFLRKRIGRVAALARTTADFPATGRVGLAHTRWATHGPPTLANTHPHTDRDHTVAVVHNGVIENYTDIKNKLVAKGLVFRSQTDTEIIAQLFGLYLKKYGDLLTAARATLRLLKGTYGLGIISRQHPTQLVGARLGSPLLIGLSQNEHWLASDAAALGPHARQIVYLNDGDIALVRADGFTINSLSRSAHPVITHTAPPLTTTNLGRFAHYMQKEIYEQPTTITNVIRGRWDAIAQTPKFGGLNITDDRLRAVRRLVFTACGTSYYAALLGEYLIEELSGLPVEVEYASELRYRRAPIDPSTLLVCLSQSGETADTLAALREARHRGLTTIGLVNAVGSSIAREVDGGIYLHAGPELGVASTKAFTAQVATLFLLALYLGRLHALSGAAAARMFDELQQLTSLLRASLALDDSVRRLASRYKYSRTMLYLGRGYHYPIALEGALKLKEVSYIHAEGYPAAEMKHGPIALVDEHTPSVIINPRGPLYDKVMSNLQEIKARRGPVIAIATDGDTDISHYADDVIYAPAAPDYLQPLVSIIPLQLLAYHMALARGCDVDKPRNLAKSVTVE